MNYKCPCQDSNYAHRVYDHNTLPPKEAFQTTAFLFDMVPSLCQDHFSQRLRPCPNGNLPVLNGLCCAGLGHSKSQMISKLRHFIGSKVTAILLNAWILPICGAASGTVLWPQQTVRSSCWSSMFNGIRPEPTNKRFNSAHLQIKFLVCRKIHSNTF